MKPRVITFSDYEAPVIVDHRLPPLLVGGLYRSGVHRYRIKSARERETRIEYTAEPEADPQEFSAEEMRR